MHKRFLLATLVFSSITPVLAVAHKQKVNTTQSSGIHLTQQQAQNPWDVTLKGYMQTSGTTYRGDKQLHNGYKTPNGVLELMAVYKQHWAFDLSYNFADDDSKASSGLEKATINYNNANYAIQAGQFAPAFGLTNTSNRDAVTFIQLPLAVSAFSPAFQQGLNVSWNNAKFAVFAAAFGPGTKEKNTNGGKNDYYGSTLRAIYVPVHKGSDVIHMGLSAYYQQANRQHELSFSTTPESNPKNDGVLVDTGTIDNARSFKTADAALAYEQGPWETQAEYLRTWVARKAGQRHASFSGYYITSSYFLTGESRTYDYPSGAFTGISPITGKYGAWQVAARYSTLNLIDGGIRGGRERNIALGLNWYPIQQVALMANVIHAKARPESAENAAKNKSVNIYALQAQVSF